MALKISNLATPKQQELLAKLEYTGNGKYAAKNLTVDAAAKIIDELFIEQKYTHGQIREMAGDYYDLPIVDIYQSQASDYDDPFSKLQRRHKQ